MDKRKQPLFLSPERQRDSTYDAYGFVMICHGDILARLKNCLVPLAF